jgi:hypothetical protein
MNTRRRIDTGNEAGKASPMPNPPTNYGVVWLVNQDKKGRVASGSEAMICNQKSVPVKEGFIGRPSGQKPPKKKVVKHIQPLNSLDDG